MMILWGLMLVLSQDIQFYKNKMYFKFQNTNINIYLKWTHSVIGRDWNSVCVPTVSAKRFDVCTLVIHLK